MRSLRKPCQNPVEDARNTPRASLEVLSENPDQPLDFWYIQPHDRKTLIDQIMPYMAGRLPKRYSLHVLMREQVWANGLVSLELVEAVEEIAACLHQILAAFWKEPRNVIAYLLRLSPLRFFVLLRFTYRAKSFERDKIFGEYWSAQDNSASRPQTYSSGLTENEVYRLTCLRKKYGASFYRRSYKNVKRCLDWTSFCTRIRAFCSMTGLHVSSNDPERNIRELRHNLTAIMMHRKWVQTTCQLDNNTTLVRNTRRDLRELNERVASDALHNINVLDETRQDVANLQSMFHKLRLACPIPSNLRQRDAKLRSEIEQRRLVSDQQLKGLQTSIENCERIFQQHTMMFTRQIEELHTDLGRTHALREGQVSAESLIICRWLLEYVPATRMSPGTLGLRWKQFWQEQWIQCAKSESHPLKVLSGDDKYNKVGKNLYSTLSDRLHKYGHQQGEVLDQKVQRVVDVIRPVHYNSDGKVDLEAERKRWLN
jgi:hypothetical protein